MASLNVPSSAKSSVPRTPSATNIRKPILDHDDDLQPMSPSSRNASRNNSETNLVAAAARARPSPALRVDSKTNLSNLIASEAEKAAFAGDADERLQQPAARKDTVSLFAGKGLKRYDFNTKQLVANSPYFRKRFAEDEGHDGSLALTPDQDAFEDLDEFSMGLFKHWLENKGKLAGPYDFHSTQHYLGLYVLAKKFEVENLENYVMDFLRHYYAREKMTAPAYRLEYIYTYTTGKNSMRTFLVRTAAYRALADKSASSRSARLSDSIKAVLSKIPELQHDYTAEIKWLGKHNLQDPRQGQDCDWHVHHHSKKCEKAQAEAWQSDGACDCVSPHMHPYFRLGGGDMADDQPTEAPKEEQAPVPVPEDKHAEAAAVVPVEVVQTPAQTEEVKVVTVPPPAEEERKAPAVVEVKPDPVPPAPVVEAKTQPEPEPAKKPKTVVIEEVKEDAKPREQVIVKPAEKAEEKEVKVLPASTPVDAQSVKSEPAPKAEKVTKKKKSWFSLGDRHSVQTTETTETKVKVKGEKRAKLRHFKNKVAEKIAMGMVKMKLRKVKLG